MQHITVCTNDKQRAVSNIAKFLEVDESFVEVVFKGKLDETEEFEICLKEGISNETTKKYNDLISRIDRAKKLSDNVLYFFKIDNLGLHVFLDESTSINVNIVAKGLDFLIKNNGETLNAIQYLVSILTNAGFRDYIRVILNYEGFREKRKEELEKIAEKFSNIVLKTKKPVTLEPMSPFERRIVHCKISEIYGIYGKSKGKEPKRSIVIYPII